MQTAYWAVMESGFSRIAAVVSGFSRTLQNVSSLFASI